MRTKIAHTKIHLLLAPLFAIFATSATGASNEYSIDPQPHHHNTRVWVDEGDGLQRSSLPFPTRHYVRSASGQRIGVAHPEAHGSFSGWLISDGERFEFTAADNQTFSLTSAPYAEDELLPFSCGADEVPISDEVWRLARGEVYPSRSAHQGAGRGGLRGGLINTVIAVDTDNEFNFEKFNNNQTAAMNWIADLFSEMNVMYQRDLNLNLVLGDVILRLDTDNPPTFDDDPWVLSASPANQALLEEFGAFWSANMNSIDRVFAMLLSGKSPTSNSSSGIAWIDGWCENQNIGGGYSVTQVFTGNFPVINDVRVIAHEIGHNAGSPHTHCYNPPVDTCFSGESGCFVGGTSCPAGGNGTMMSYCHLSGCNTDNLIEFHPTVIGLLDSFVAAHLGSCLMAPVDLIFLDGLEDLP